MGIMPNGAIVIDITAMLQAYIVFLVGFVFGAYVMVTIILAKEDKKQ